MPIVKCNLSEDGKLIPSGVEFEPGDTIQFNSDEPVQVDGEPSSPINVKKSFTLDGISAKAQGGGKGLNLSGFQQDARLPPPPPPNTVKVSITAGGKSKHKTGAAG